MVYSLVTEPIPKVDDFCIESRELGSHSKKAATLLVQLEQNIFQITMAESLAFEKSEAGNISCSEGVCRRNQAEADDGCDQAEQKDGLAAHDGRHLGPRWSWCGTVVRIDGRCRVELRLSSAGGARNDRI